MARVVKDPTLGRFEWDAEFGYWRGALALPSGRVARLDIAPAHEHIERPGASEVFAAAYPVAAWLRESEAEVVGAECVGGYSRMVGSVKPISLHP
jgi:hypothetical protein